MAIASQMKLIGSAMYTELNDGAGSLASQAKSGHACHQAIVPNGFLLFHCFLQILEQRSELESEYIYWREGGFVGIRERFAELIRCRPLLPLLPLLPLRMTQSSFSPATHRCILLFGVTLIRQDRQYYGENGQQALSREGPMNQSPCYVFCH